MTIMLNKDLVRQQMENLPDNFSLEEFIERMILIAKIEAAEKQTDKHEVLSEDEVKKEIESWFK